MKKQRSIQYLMKSRSILLFIIFILLFIFLGYRIVYINIIDDQQYKQSVLAQQINNLTNTNNQIIPKRGSILDNKGIPLAESHKIYNVIFDPAVIIQHKQEIIDETLKLLGDTLADVTVEDLSKLLVDRKGSHYELIAKELTYIDIQPIEEALAKGLIKGVAFEEQYQRTYPYNTLASDVIGFLRSDGEGLWGIEKTYNTYLSGTIGRRFGSVDGQNRFNQEDIVATTGYNVELNLDFTIQTYIEEAISRFYETEEALSVRVVVMNPQNGKILGMASYPNFDLNNPYDMSHLLDEEVLNAMTTQEKSDFLNTLWRNGSISKSYEPGSTFKPFTFAMTLEEYILDPHEHNFLCNGYKVPYQGQAPIYCWKRTGHGDQTIYDALSNSCNVAFMDMGEAIGREFFYNYQRMFGFGAVTNIDLFGEESFRDLVYSYDQLNPVEIQTSAFGQGFQVTPIQLIAGFSSLINGGYLYEPQLMRRIVSEEGLLIVENKPKLQRKVISEEVSFETSTALRHVVDEGTGQGAKVEGYSIGGKTGTAEKGNRETKDYIVSFIGFSPVVSPEIITLVVVDDPVGVDVNSRYAARIFKDIMGNVLPYLRVTKEYEAEVPEVVVEPLDNPNEDAVEENNGEEIIEETTEETTEEAIEEAIEEDLETPND
ncbi:Peptidoglycan glycosyltransferase [Petrocella atlantisensis]|uniref:Peptidoglycan glycosyltransferase n=1 Tax=Petrocella atlantisensis TaxID=2173034 RepID=A0A3P7NT21_9FIRM|nr:penicillin-binding transpeptidase domain-containing protein [Petrocella atlantisensis]VDN46344.1 Peptidoglycan glycosyltransferase [Petrocella atlantisensis]